MLVARRFVISGRVQGVGFRYFTQEWALREGVTGWVRNLPDGRVEAHVEGEAESVTRVERALRSGPRGARVQTVTVDVEDVTGAYDTRWDNDILNPAFRALRASDFEVVKLGWEPERRLGRRRAVGR